MDVNQYLEIFVEESREHLQYLNENLLELEKNPDKKDIFNEIFRIAHTLKGMAGTMGFKKVSNLTHEMENVLQEIRSGNIKIDDDIIDLLFKCLDALEEYINYISENEEEGNLDSSNLVNALNRIISRGNKDLTDNKNIKNNENILNEYVIDVVKKASQQGLKSYNIKVTLNKQCMLKAARAFIVFNTLDDDGEIIQSIPSAQDIEDEKFDFSFTIVYLTNLDEDKIKQKILNISEIDDVEITNINLNMQNIGVVNGDKSIESFDDKIKKGNDQGKQEKQNNKHSKMGKTVRVDINRLDNLMNLVSELIIIKTRMEDMGYSNENEDMNEAIEYLERITTSLHDAVMKVRMVPIERVFNRFPRMVRDLSKELGKEINLVMSGEETEVDRTVIDEIGDPLIHLIRNSIDHGIESPEERKKANKDEVGTVKLKAYPDGNNVVIEVEDDGQGINIEKVRAKVVEKGLISSSRAKNLTKDELIDFLFKAGFSTADKISSVSGRGVGLDVVKTKIESIGGVLEVETSKGIGSKFIIRIPLTLAIIQALLVKLLDEIYAIPLSSISEIVNIDRDKIRKVQGKEVVLYRNKTLPIIRLEEILGLKTNNNNNELTVVVVKKGDKLAGLIVDSLIGQQEIVIKSLGKYLSNIKYLAGATILGNGKISLILDINSLF